MRTKSWCSLYIILSVLFLNSCKKDGSAGGSASAPKAPTVTTTVGSAITNNSAQSGGSVTSDGGSPVTARGVCWSTVTPKISDSKTVDGSGTGSFVSALSNLDPYTAYFARAYATNAIGTSYGSEVLILTLPGVILITSDVYVTNYKRLCEIQITLKGSNLPGALPVTQSGVCWGKSQNPTIADTKINNGPVTVSYSHFELPLTFGINSTYYVRAFATTSAGTTYSNQVTYTTGIDIGLSHGGGVIYFIDNTKQHGLIAATSDQGVAIPWAPGNLYATITNTTSYTDGADNTTKIISKYGNSGTYAAKLCRDYRGGGFTDWFLPAAYQLDYMKTYQDAIGGFHGSAFLNNYNYWSSSENNYFLAWGYDFNPRYYTIGTAEKRSFLYVRAARAF